MSVLTWIRTAYPRDASQTTTDTALYKKCEYIQNGRWVFGHSYKVESDFKKIRIHLPFCVVKLYEREFLRLLFGQTMT